MTKTAAEKLEKSESDILLQSPFLGRTLLGSPWLASQDIPVMATNGLRFVYNPDWVSASPLWHVTTARVHECYHNILGHIPRRGTRDPDRWNIAADYEVNGYLTEAGYQLIPGMLYNPAYAGMTAEQIYAILPPAALPGYMLDLDFSELSPEAQAAVEQAWRVAASGTLWGTLPDSLRRSLERQLSPRPALAERLAARLSLLPSDLVSWSRPHRRVPGFPGRELRPRGHIVAVVDSSGSISQNQLKEALEHVLCLPSLGVLDVIFADAAVQSVHRGIDSIAGVLAAARAVSGGGGTDFRPAIAAAEAWDPDLIIYFTDGLGHYPDAVSSTEIIWVGPESPAPIGETISP